MWWAKLIGIGFDVGQWEVTLCGKVRKVTPFLLLDDGVVAEVEDKGCVLWVRIDNENLFHTRREARLAALKMLEKRRAKVESKIRSRKR
jgi:hypothetical protein